MRSSLWRSGRAVLLGAGVVLGAALLVLRLVDEGGPDATPARGPLVWAEDFSPPAGCTFDPRTCPADGDGWTHNVGANGWGNEELQEYTSATANSRRTADGTLQLVLRGSDDVPAFTSARLTSREKVVGYGYVEARIKLPDGRASGTWPAFWLWSDDQPWPDTSEIDVMETVNGDDGFSTTVHGGGGNGRWRHYRWHETGAASDGRWHTYGVMIHPRSITFYRDGAVVRTITPDDIPSGATWPLTTPDRRYQVILNVAMGGSYPGDPDGSAPLPYVMSVDYVRHWALPGAPVPSA